MKCLCPHTVPNPSYDPCSALPHRRRARITVPCGKCYACLMRKANEWALRLSHECECSKSAFFVTLTYDDCNLPHNRRGYPCFCYEDVQKFIKRIRKAYPDCKIKYFVVSEYGSKYGRPHYHAIFFNLPFRFDCECQYWLSRYWEHGFTYVGSVTPKSIMYCCKYCFKRRSKTRDPRYAEKMRCSNREFIGKCYCRKHLQYYSDRPDRHYIQNKHGVKFGMPRAYVNFIHGVDTIPRDIYSIYGFEQLLETNERAIKHAQQLIRRFPPEKQFVMSSADFFSTFEYGFYLNEQLMAWKSRSERNKAKL